MEFKNRLINIVDNLVMERGEWHWGAGRRGSKVKEVQISD